MAATLKPEQRDELELLTRKATGWGEAFINGDVYDAVRKLLSALLPAHERMVREQVAKELLAADPVEWALAGQHAGSMAARIARGES